MIERKPPLYGRFKEDCAWCDRMKGEEQHRDDLCKSCADLPCDHCVLPLAQHIEEDRWHWKCPFDATMFQWRNGYSSDLRNIALLLQRIHISK